MSDICQKIIWEEERDESKGEINSHEWVTVEAGC